MASDYSESVEETLKEKSKKKGGGSFKQEAPKKAKRAGIISPFGVISTDEKALAEALMV